jgi:hypothetical protein
MDIGGNTTDVRMIREALTQSKANCTISNGVWKRAHGHERLTTNRLSAVCSCRRVQANSRIRQARARWSRTREIPRCPVGCTNKGVTDGPFNTNGPRDRGLVQCQR